jgi:hypothetical protein
MNIEKLIKYKLFEIAVQKGYCNIYSSYEDTEAAIQRIVSQHLKKRGK